MMVDRTNGTTTKAETNISASALYKYLGWSKSKRTGKDATDGVVKNGVTLLMYLDIFKNFFANTQEKTFAMIKGGVSRLSIASNIYKIPAKNINVYPTAGTSVGSFDESDNWQLYWENVKVLGKKNGSEVITTMADLSTNPTRKIITIDKVTSVITEIVDIEFSKNYSSIVSMKLKHFVLS